MITATATTTATATATATATTACSQPPHALLDIIPFVEAPPLKHCTGLCTDAMSPLVAWRDVPVVD